jgi:hypothetical protein
MNTGSATDSGVKSEKCVLTQDERGIFQAGIPTAGGALWGCAWRFGTGIGFRLRVRGSITEG